MNKASSVIVGNKYLEKGYRIKIKQIFNIPTVVDLLKYDYAVKKKGGHFNRLDRDSIYK